MQQHILAIQTTGRGLVDITAQINELIIAVNWPNGLCHLFLQHTSASLILCENADLQVQMDLEAFIQRLIPDGDPLFQHIAEGKDDMPAHIRTILTQNSLLIPINAGRLCLGMWQGLFLWEHRYSPHKRQLFVSLL